MTQDHSALLAQLDALKSADSGAVFAELLRAGLQALIEAEATEAIGAARYQRSADRGTHRNGHRPKTVSTTAGDIDVQIPKLRGRVVFPVAAGAAPPHRQGVARGDHGGLCARDLHSQCR
jgi:transposase-like protein